MSKTVKYYPKKAGQYLFSVFSELGNMDAVEFQLNSTSVPRTVYEFQGLPEDPMSTLENGIFARIVKYFESGSSFVSTFLKNQLPFIDWEYATNHSKDKKLSTLVNNMLRRKVKQNSYSGQFPLSEKDYEAICSIIYLRFIAGTKKWPKLLDSLSIGYDPTNPYYIENQDGETNTGTIKTEDDGTNNETTNTEQKSNNTKYRNGFNAESTNPHETISDNGSGKEQVGVIYKSNRLETQNLTTKKNKTTKGNIGNRTPMDLIAEERNFAAWQLYDVFFDDVDSVIASYIYLVEGELYD